LAAQASTGRTGNPTSPEEATVRWLARNAKVALNAGNTYGLGGANRARVNIATSRKTLEAALTSIARTLDGLKKSTSAL
jgi:bifunctional pyridoxal-dependent enzyme with beta-cystathionase and maltose regulon repressor activities